MVIVAFLVAAALQHPADFSKGAHLYGACQAAVRMTDDPNSQQSRTEMPSSTYCFGYLAGYIDGLNVLTEKACVYGASVSTVARVYVTFMQRNPTLMDEAKHLGVVMALKDAYPWPQVTPFQTPAEFSKHASKWHTDRAESLHRVADRAGKSIANRHDW